MRDIDNMIEEALGQEERDILRRIGGQPGFFGQVFGIFQGPGGWVSIVMMVAQAAIFLAGAWAAWQFFQVADPVSQLRWGLPAATLLILATILKMALLPRMEANNIIRELKRLELQLALRRD